MNNRKLSLMVVLAAGLSALPASAFSLLGPYTSWQVTAIGYQLSGDIGGPMNLKEGFRWNVPVITYACDKSFLDYFGSPGQHAVDQAISYFNDLDAPKKISADLAEYSTSTLRENYEAKTLGIIDIKTTAMSLLMEEMGFADPIRFTFTLRARRIDTPAGGTPFTNYVTIMRNFDPVTLQPTRFVNGALYTYFNEEFRGPPADFADAVEQFAGVGDPTASVPVASYSAPGSVLLSTALGGAGIFRTGLTRDDVGGIRYLYHPDNIAVEGLLTNVTGNPFGGSTAGWVTFAGGLTNQAQVTNTVFLVGTNSTNQIVITGLRGGRKLHFQRVFFDSLIGQTFTPITNQYTDVTIGSNLTLVVQTVQRGITAPDIIFVAEDLGLFNNLVPVLNARTGTAGWIDNDALNGADETTLSHGPGVIPPQVRISFSDQLPFFLTDNSFLDDFPGESTSFTSGVWGSFDGSTNAPVIYPLYQNISLNKLRQQILHGP